MCRQLKRLFKRRLTHDGEHWGGRWREHTGNTDWMNRLREQTRENMRTASLGAVREFLGESAEDVTGMISQVETAGGFDDFVKGHEIYSAMAGVHLTTAREAYGNAKMRGALRLVRLTLEDENIVSPEGTWEPSEN